LPGGAVDTSAACTITKDGGRKVELKGRALAAGVYELVCKTEGGILITDFGKPLTWNFNLKSKLKGLNNPVAYLLDESGSAVEIKGAKYDANSDILSFDSTSDKAVYVLAAKAPGLPLNLVAAILAVLIVVGGVIVVVLRRRQKVNYDDYLRQKYYNL
jgi:hypothetical protein